ncbi:MAG: PAS domain S-box protein [Vicinamibacterales bacterium]
MTPEAEASRRQFADALQRRVDRQALLLTATRAMVLAQQDEASLARVVFDTVAPHLGADVCFNYRFVEGQHHLALAAGFGIPDELRAGSQVLELGEAFCGTVAKTTMPLVADATRIALDEKGAFVRQMGVRAYACHPLLARSGRLLGTFSLASRTRDTFDNTDVEFLQTLCHFLSLAWERIRADEERRRSDERFRLLVEGVRDYAIIMLDPRGHVVTWNSGAGALTGYMADEIVGRHVSVLYPPESVLAAHPQRELALAAEQGHHEEEGWRMRKDGRRFWANVTTTALREPGGPVTGFAKVTRDLTERKHAADAILAQETFLHTIVNVVVDGIITIDQDGTITTVNAATERIFGWDESELVGRNVKVLMPDPYRHEHDGYIERYQRTGEARIIGIGREVAGLRKDGSTFPLELSVGEFHIEGRRFFAGVVRDITERKHAEERLRRSEAQFREMANNVPIAIWMSDTDGRLTFLNDQWHAMTGQPPLQGLGAGWLEVVHPDDRGRAGATIAAGTRDRTAFHTELRLRSPVGGDRHVLQYARPRLSVDGTYLGFIGCVLDITEQRSVEEQLRQAQKMDAFGQLAGGVAHDFNNLLTVISGFSELALTALPPDDPNRELITAISDAGTRAAALTRQLLAFSRKTVLTPEVLDVNAVVHETEKMLRRLIGEDIVLTTVLAPDARAIMVDRGHLGQVLMNLAVNARDAMPRGGRLTIETANVTRTDEEWSDADMRAGDYVVVAVTDTGVGMPPEVKARIFEPFFTTKGPGRGTGLGLAVVHGIIKQSGGALGVYSEPGVGTCFKLYFPAASPSTTRKVGEPVGQAPRGHETVLLAEDEEAVRALATVALQRHGYTVLSASGGTEALHLAETHGAPIALLITDVVMPHMDGRELAGALQAAYPNMKVLFLSGYTDDAVVRHGILHQHVAYLQKPYSLVALARKVREVLDTH